MQNNIQDFEELKETNSSDNNEFYGEESEIGEELEFLVQKNKRLIAVICVIAILLMMVTGMCVQQVKLGKLNEQEAYLVSRLISEHEEYLWLSYGLTVTDISKVLPQRDVWCDNPCKETADAYCDALEEFIFTLDNYANPTEKSNEPVVEFVLMKT